MEFDRFGRRVGRRLLKRRSLAGFNYLLTPVNIVRYFEFPFALSCLPSPLERCLDVSSPRLFSLYVATQFPWARIQMINPDARDISQTTAMARALQLSNIRTRCCAVDVLRTAHETYDCIWSLSVVEHIAGPYDDRRAVEYMYEALKAGGRLILTVPVNRRFEVEYRSDDAYGTQAGSTTQGQYFFQRVYDRRAIWERLLSPLGKEPTIVRWFGETTPGHFADYTRRWMREGHACTVDDPREIADHYREYPTWEAMPGMGICGLMIEK